MWDSVKNQGETGINNTKETSSPDSSGASMVTPNVVRGSEKSHSKVHGVETRRSLESIPWCRIYPMQDLGWRSEWSGDSASSFLRLFC